MPCDTRLKPRQTIKERAKEVKERIDALVAKLASGAVKPVIDKRTGAVAFSGWNDQERDGITDACAYRRVLVQGTALAKAALTRAEQIAGRAVNREALTNGVHSHDGGHTWHHGH